MIIPVRCISCGKPVSGLWETFKARAASGEEPKKILDDLGLDRYCCRTLFLTHKDILSKVARYRV